MKSVWSRVLVDLYVLLISCVSSVASSVQVIGTGLPHTGTTSLSKALTELGYHVYDKESVFRNHSHFDMWMDLANGTLEQPDWDLVLDGIDATCDLPLLLFWKTQMRKFPMAKVILTRRDPEDWYESYKSTYELEEMLYTQTPYALFASAQRRLTLMRYMRKMTFGASCMSRFDKADWIASYNDHLQAVMEGVDVSRLLVMSITEGWEPLCAFLGVAVPDTPFPHAMARAEQIGHLRLLIAVAWVCPILSLAFVVTACWCLWRRRWHVARCTRYSWRRACGVKERPKFSTDPTERAPML